MTAEQRLRRAAEILWGGIARWRLAELNGETQPPSITPPTVPDTSDVPPSGTVTLDHVIAFLNTVGSASPKDVAHHFSISQSSAFRRLKKLLAMGRIERTGQTNALRYSVPKKCSVESHIHHEQHESKKTDIADVLP